jgi:hypothetical protein
MADRGTDMQPETGDQFLTIVRRIIRDGSRSTDRSHKGGKG